MRRSLRENIFSYLQIIAPFFISAFFIFLEHIAFNFDVLNIRPMFGLICVFFWLINRPDVFNIFSVFILGIISDILTYTPMGTCIFAYLLMYIFTIRITKYISNKLFVVSFTTFGVLSFAAVIAQWLLLCAYYKQFLPFSGAFLSWLMTVDIYPLIAIINIKAMAYITREDVQ